MKTNFSAAQLPGFNPSYGVLTPHFSDRDGAIYRRKFTHVETEYTAGKS